jgi:hypothetical protein
LAVRRVVKEADGEKGSEYKSVDHIFREQGKSKRSVWNAKEKGKTYLGPLKFSTADREV